MRLPILVAGLLAAACLAGCSNSSSEPVGAAGPATPANLTRTLVVSQDGNLVLLDQYGRNPLTLTTGFLDVDPAFRPDGSDLVFSRIDRSTTAGADLYRIRPDGTGLTNLTGEFRYGATQPDYAPDGRIAFTTEIAPGDRDICILRVDGSIVAVTSGPDDDSSPSFSTDGSRIAFQRDGRICEVPAAGGTVTNLTDGLHDDQDPSYCPPDDDIVFSRNGDLWNIRKGVVSRLSTTPHASEFDPKHASDPNQVYTLAAQTPGSLGRANNPTSTGDIVTMNRNGGDYRQLTTGLRANSLSVAQRAAVTTGVSTTITNNSGLTMYAYVFGYDPTNGGAQSYLTTSGTVAAYTAAAGTPPVVATIGPNGGTATLTLPLLNKARVYFSPNANLVFTAFEESPQLNNGSELYDFVEYDYTSAGGTFTCDTSCVEAFALPFKLETTPAGTANGVVTPVGMNDGARTQVFNAITALGSPWSNLIVKDGSGNPTRLLAPWHGDLASPVFPGNYLDPSIQTQWGQSITLNTYLVGNYTATASSGAWTFTPSSGTGSNVTFPAAPSSTVAFSCNIPFTSNPAADGGVGSRITAILAAGLNRGTLLQPNLNPTPIPFVPVTPGQPDFSPGDFYLTGPTAPLVPQVNQYSKVLHQNSIANYQYGFASDDQGSQSSTLTVPSGIQAFSITISKF